MFMSLLAVAKAFFFTLFNSQVTFESKVKECTSACHLYLIHKFPGNILINVSRKRAYKV